ncbi:MAG: ABC transporter ATP-binding protein [Alphaproteobacteria bacterium]
MRDLRLSFGGIAALDGCSLDVPAGSITGLIGPNGAGKTTLFNAVSGQLRPDAGEVYLDGARVTGLAPHRLFRRGLVRTFQIPRLFEQMTVFDNLLVAAQAPADENVIASLLGTGGLRAGMRAAAGRADEVLGFLDLGDHRAAYAGTLSGGQKKLLELGRAMMAEPRVVLLDEPGAGVNPTLMVRLVDGIVRLNRERGYTFCLVEHDMELVARLCDPVVVLAEGRVLASGSMAQVRADAAVRAAYLGRAAAREPVA